MKKYALFTFDVYYPSGGMKDLYGFYDTIEEAKKDLFTEDEHFRHRDLYQIVDTTTWKTVEDGVVEECSSPGCYCDQNE